MIHVNVVGEDDCYVTVKDDEDVNSWTANLIVNPDEISQLIEDLIAAKAKLQEKGVLS